MARISGVGRGIGDQGGEVFEFVPGGAIGVDRLDHRRKLGEFARQFHIGLGRQGGGQIAFQRRMPGDQRIEFLFGQHGYVQ